MNKRTARIMLLSAALAATAVSITGATEQAMPKGKGVPAKMVPFSLTGVYSGPLSGEITVDGQSVFINDKTSLHKVGVGPVEAGQSISNTAVYIGGVMKGKKAIATMIVIGERETSDDFSQATVPGADRPAGPKDTR